MNKNIWTKLTIIFLLLFIVCINSCDSLWKVQETTSVSFTIDINEILAKSTHDPIARNNHAIRSGEELEGQKLIVSLHKDSDNSLVAEQIKTMQGNFESIQVTFENLRVGLHIYAKIIIQNEADLIAFSARSESIRVTAKNNYLKARTNGVFLNPNAAPDADNNNGLTPDTAVKSLEKAVERLGGAGNLVKGATIYLMDSITISTNTTWTYGNIIVKRYGTVDFPMVKVNNDTELDINLGEATLDGNSTGSGIYTAYNYSVTIKNGTITNTENAFVQEGGPEIPISYKISNMRIIDNKNGIEAGTLSLSGGTIIIRNNTEKNAKAVITTVTENLSNTSLIGLTISQDISVGDTLVYVESASANDIKINPLNFFIDGYGAGEHVEVDESGSLIYKPGEMPETTYYVGGANSQYSSVQEAVNAITGINTGSKTYTIIVNGTITEEGPTADASGNTTDDAMIEIESPDTQLYLTIKGENNATIDAGARFTIDSNGQATVTNPGKQKRVFYITEGGTNVTLENITITGGYETGISELISGGGIYVSSARVTLKRNTNITKNLVLTTDSYEANGGGLFGTNAARITMQGASSVSFNTASGTTIASDTSSSATGGGIFIEGYSSIFMEENSSISYNTSMNTGGGIRGFGAQSISLSGNAKIKYNKAHITGAGIYDDSTIIITGGTVSHNSLTATKEKLEMLYPGNYSAGIHSPKLEFGGNVYIHSNTVADTIKNLLVSDNMTMVDSLTGSIDFGPESFTITKGTEHTFSQADMDKIIADGKTYGHNYDKGTIGFMVEGGGIAQSPEAAGSIKYTP